MKKIVNIMALFQLMLVFSFVWIVKSGLGINVPQRNLENVQHRVLATNAVQHQARPQQTPLLHPLAILPSDEPIPLPKSCKHLSIANIDFEDGWQWINPKSNRVKDAIWVYCKEDGSSCIYPNGSEKPLLLSPGTELKYDEHEIRVLQKISRSAEQEIKYKCSSCNYNGAEFKLYNQNDEVISTPNLHPERQFGVCNGTAPGNVKIEDLRNLPIVKYVERSSMAKEVMVGPVCYK